MGTTDAELEKMGIKVICPISTLNVNEIGTYVAKLICSKMPELKLDYNTVFMSIVRLPMYIAELPEGQSDACYFYKNSSIYFRKGLTFDKIKTLAVHESIHHLQEVKDLKGNLKRLGLCNYVGNKAFGTALNEGAVQLIASYLTDEKKDVVKYYDITLPTDSPSYYPLVCNLVKQIGYVSNFGVLFDSTIYANDAFFNRFTAACGESAAYKIQQNLDKLVAYEEKISSLNQKIQTEDLLYKSFKKATDKVKEYKNKIKQVFLDTQNLIITSFFNKETKNLLTITRIEEYRKYLYSFKNLIGNADGYSFFNDFYIQKMTELDERYEAIVNNKSLTVVKNSKVHILFNAIRKLFGANANQYENEIK